MITVFSQILTKSKFCLAWSFYAPRFWPESKLVKNVRLLQDCVTDSATKPGVSDFGKVTAVRLKSKLLKAPSEIELSRR